MDNEMRFSEFHNRWHRRLVLATELITAFGEMRTLLATIGIDIEMVCGWRGEKDQEEAFKNGYSKAKFGSSAHNFAAAFDLVPVDEKGQPTWDAPQDVWDKIGNAGKKFGLEWGGDFKTILDRPHFQVRGWQARYTELFHLEPPIG